MIKIANLSKAFYQVQAIDNVTLTIPQGEVVGLLGPNGAGKTTLFRLIAGLIKPDAGNIQSQNGRLWPRIGYKPDRLLFPNKLRVADYLKMTAGLSNIPTADTNKAVFDSLVRVDLVNAANKRIGDLSKGMRQRVGLAQALIGDPPLLLLDEPSNGLDPAAQADMSRRIQELHAAGKTILLSSHQLHEVTQVCTELIILHQGRVHYQNSMEKALSVRSHTLIRADRPLGGMKPIIGDLHEGIGVEGSTLVLRGDAKELRRQILIMLLSADFDILHVEEKRMSLAEIYMETVQ